MFNLLSLAVAFTVTALASLALIATKRFHGYFSMDGLDGVQKLHIQQTPRIGGVAVVAGLVAAWTLSAPDAHRLLGPMMLAAIPAFAFGLAEDCTKKVSVLARLLATTFSGVLAWYITGVAMQNTGLPPLDFLLSFMPFAVLFTAFAVGGVANAINIIDGFNGLAAGSLAIMFGAMGLISLNVADPGLAVVCFLLVAISLGFGAVNWPSGKIFLGDGGAYLLGFLLAWVAVLLPTRNPSVNAWATILVCAYPVLEVGFSVRRRRNRIGAQAGQPDKAHLHHFIHRRIVRKICPSLHATSQNGMTSPFCWLYCLLPAGWAVLFARDTAMLVFGFLLAIFIYGAIYARLTQFRWSLSAKTLTRTNPENPVLGP